MEILLSIPLRIEIKSAVLKRLGLSKATLHRYITKGIFPPPINMGEKSVGFLSYEVDAYIAASAINADKLLLVKSLIAKRADLKSKIPSLYDE
ncbi:AlpA family phage regulatory protein [Vibrio mimicus]